MNTSAPGASAAQTATPAPPPRKLELAEVLESYLAQLEAGRPADPEGLIAAHPGLARPLRACLRVMHLAQGLDEPGELRVRPIAVDCGAFGSVAGSSSSRLDGHLAG